MKRNISFVLIGAIFSTFLFGISLSSADYGTDTNASTADAIFYGDNSGDRAGQTLAILGDVNGDGYDDFAVSAELNDDSATDNGEVYLFYGSATPSWSSTSIGTEADVVLSDTSYKANTGQYMDKVGDLNGDGYDDIAITTEDKVYVVMGGTSLSSTIDLTTSADVTLTGIVPYSVGGGDFNGDGYSDLVVGDIEYDYTGGFGTETDAGAAYVFLGSSSWSSAITDADADNVYISVADHFYVGSSVTGAGDINSDGYEDLLIGADGHSSYGNPKGRAFLVLGNNTSGYWDGSEKDLIDSGSGSYSDATYKGQSSGDKAGDDVAPAGDVNGDGYDDLLIGAPFHDGTAADAGRAYLILGSASPSTTDLVDADLIIDGQNTSDLLGFSLSGGDVDNDGYSDILVGAYYNDDFANNAGKAYVVYGQSSFSSSDYDEANDIRTSFDGESSVDYFGIAVAANGDINGDGAADLLMGGSRYNSYAGSAYLFLGDNHTCSARISGTQDLTDLNDFDHYIRAEAGPHKFAQKLFYLGDFFGDGVDDALIGAHRWRASSSDPFIGAFYVVDATFASRWMKTENGDYTFRINGETPQGEFAWSIGAGDVDGDGTTDFVVGAPEDNSAYVIFGDTSMSGDYDIATELSGSGTLTVVKLTGRDSSGKFGRSIEVADMNNDGNADIMIGDRIDSTYKSSAGATFFFDGSQFPTSTQTIDLSTATYPSIQYLVLEGETAGDFLGETIAYLGDVDKDGDGELALGATWHNTSSNVHGSVYVLSQSTLSSLGMYSSAITSAGVSNYDLRITGESNSDEFGLSLSGNGDINGDGYADYVISSNTVDGSAGTDTGAAYVFFGASDALDTSNVSAADADLIIEGAAASDTIAHDSALIGDVDNDGFDDLLLASQTYTLSGLGYLFYGNSIRSYLGTNTTLDQTDADAELKGAVHGDTTNSFNAASKLGDIDNDGVDDIFLGSPLNHSGWHKGIAYVIDGVDCSN